MTTVTVSPKFQVVIPKEARESIGVSPGEKMQVVVCENRIELIPLEPIANLRGFLKGIDTRVPRGKDRV